MEKLYLQYAEFLSDIATMEFELSAKRRALEEIRDEIEQDKETDGSFGLVLSAHASTNISNRLSELASKSHIIYNDVMNSDKPSKSIIWPANMTAFIIGILASARMKNKYIEKESKNTEGGKEYHYEVEIKKWSTNKQTLVFVAIVESNVIKTGYFNWIENKGKN